MGLLILATSALLATTHSLAALTPSEQRGLTFALINCAKCHSIDRAASSHPRTAPPFHDLHTRYPIESLAEAFAEGIKTGHARYTGLPAMPEFQLDRDQIYDLLAYMRTLEQ